MRSDATRADLELQVDALRMSDWLVTMPLLVLKFYAILGRSNFASNYDSMFSSQDQPAILASFMVACGAVVRLTTDDFQMQTYTAVRYGCVVLYAAALTSLVLLLVELQAATAGIDDSATLRGFFWVWVGYPIVSLASMAWRWGMRTDQNTEWRVAVFRDVAYGALDAYSKGIFAVLTIGAYFGVPLLGWSTNIPVVWSR